MNIPKEMQETYDVIAKTITDYCNKYLNPEYETLCLNALAKLSRKRPSPLKSGRPKTWAAGIIYAIGSNNFIFDKQQPIHMTAKEMVEPLEISASTAANKAAEIKKLLKIDQFASDWSLPSLIEKNPLFWMLEINGLPVDARSLSPEIQQLCYEKGLIPHVYNKDKDNQGDEEDKDKD